MSPKLMNPVADGETPLGDRRAGLGSDHDV